MTVLLGATAADTSALTTTATSPASYGTAVPLTLTVNDTTPAFRTPSGTASFYDGSTLLGTTSPGNPPFTFTPANFAVGSHTLTAVYSGDSRTAGSTSNAATVQVNPASEPITLTFSPAGLLVSVDGGAAQATPFTTTLNSGTHTISVSPVQPGAPGTQYVFTGWSDSGAVSHSITVGAAPASFTAIFQTQYLLTTGASPAAGGSISPGPGYYNAGSLLTVTAAPNAGYTFANFSGAVTGTASPQSFTIGAPANVAANFTALAPQLAVSAGVPAVSGASVTVPLTVANSGSGAAANVTIAGVSILSFTGTGPVTVSSAVPVAVGTIGASPSSGSASIVFNWPNGGLLKNAKNKVSLSANGGSYTITSSTLTTIW